MRLSRYRPLGSGEFEQVLDIAGLSSILNGSWGCEFECCDKGVATMSKKQVKEVQTAYAAPAATTGEDIPVAKITARELNMLIQSALKEALEEVFGDPDAGLELRPEFEEELRQAVAYVAAGGRLLSLEELIQTVAAE